MMDILERARDYLHREGFEGPYAKRLDLLTGREGICIRHLAYIKQTQYFDGTEIGSYRFQVIVRNASEQTAKFTCEDVRAALEGVVLESENGSFQMGADGLQIYVTPQELMLEEAGFFAWEVEFSANIERKG